MLFRKLIVLAIALFLLAGCTAVASELEPTRSDTELAETVPALTEVQAKGEMPLLRYRRAGGLKGFGPSEFVWEFYADGRVVSSDGRSWQLSPAQAATFVGGLADAGFFDLNADYVPEDTCCDRATHTITLNIGGQEKTVTTLDGADMPPSLATVMDEINVMLADLAEQAQE